MVNRPPARLDGLPRLSVKRVPEVFQLRTHGLLLAFAALLVGSIATHAAAARKVHILVLREHGIGSAAAAQPYVDKFVAVAASKNQWSAAQGKYVTRRSQAAKYIKKHQPQFGIMSVGAFLAMRSAHNLDVLGYVATKHAGGRRYHLISRDKSDLAGCKGEKVASNHFGDKKLINKVVAVGAFKISDFTPLRTRRPVQTIKAVLRGKAACALIDDAQFSELTHIDGTAGIRSVWKSAKLPPMPVVAFSSASSSERAKFKASFGAICSGGGKSYCDKVGIVSLNASGVSHYQGVIAQYGN